VREEEQEQLTDIMTKLIDIATIIPIEKEINRRELAA
jgi:hypothetical protein